MHWIAPMEKDASSASLEQRLWDGANPFHANSGREAQECSGPIHGLIFLRFAGTRHPPRVAAGCGGCDDGGTPARSRRKEVAHESGSGQLGRGGVNRRMQISWRGDMESPITARVAGNLGA